MRHVLLIVLLGCVVQMSLAEEGMVPVENGSYADDAAAGKAWQGLWGTAGARRGDVLGRAAVVLPCNFAGTTMERASWDRAVKLNLARSCALEIDLSCADPSPVAHFSLYLKSGGGWYSGQLKAPVAGKWTTVRIRKSEMRVEGSPAGWSRIDAIRLSAWRGGDRDTTLALGAIRDVKADSSVILVRNESALKRNPKDEPSVRQYPEEMSHELARLGFDFVTVGDQDLPTMGLTGKELVVLPYAPELSAEALAALLKHMEKGGKVLAFYQISGKLAEAIGVKPVGFAQSGEAKRFSEIRAVAGAVEGMPAVTKQRSWNITRVAVQAEHAARPKVVAWWHDAAGNDVKEPAIILSDRGGFMTHVLLKDDAANQRRLMLALMGKLNPDLWDEVRQRAARALQDEENRMLGGMNDFYDRVERRPELRALRGRYQAALKSLASSELGAGTILDRSHEARQLLVEIYARVQDSLKGEVRGFWCHSAMGPKDLGWDKAIKALADNGFNSILPNMLWGGVAYYPSDVLPVAPEVKEQGDQIALCLAACKKYGVQCHVWKVNWNMGWRFPKEFGERMKREGRTQVKFDGSPEDRWLCPSHPANQKLEIDSMLEVAAKYAVDGIHFDYIRYPDDQRCFCNGCRERFEKSLGQKVEPWPGAIKKDAELKKKWNDFRRGNISAVVEAVSREARKVRPGIKISAAVFSNWAVDRDGVAQDWKMWCDKGWLDFVCPMDYTPHDSDFAAQVKRQVEWAGKVQVYPGIGLSVWADTQDVVGLAEKIKIARAAGCRGFTVFEYKADLCESLLPMLRMGVTKE